MARTNNNNNCPTANAMALALCNAGYVLAGTGWQHGPRKGQRYLAYTHPTLGYVVHLCTTPGNGPQAQCSVGKWHATATTAPALALLLATVGQHNTTVTTGLAHATRQANAS